MHLLHDLPLFRYLLPTTAELHKIGMPENYEDESTRVIYEVADADVADDDVAAEPLSVWPTFRRMMSR